MTEQQITVQNNRTEQQNRTEQSLNRLHTHTPIELKHLRQTDRQTDGQPVVDIILHSIFAC